ncbi:transposase, partial [Vibrio alginolyticus]
SKEYPEQSARTRRIPLPITPWVEWIEEQWNNGQHNASQLWREMAAGGFSGSIITVRRHVAHLREGLNTTAISSFHIPSPSRVSRWLTPWRILKDENAYANRFSHSLCQKDPRLKEAKQLALEFYQMLKIKDESQLKDWFSRVAQSELTELKRVATSMEKDESAIRAAISTKWSNGVVEGHVNRLKMLKRQMYGRAGFELLRRRVMSPLA